MQFLQSQVPDLSAGRCCGLSAVLRQRQALADRRQAQRLSPASWRGTEHNKGQHQAKAAEWAEADLQDSTLLPLYPCFSLLFMLSFSFSFLFSSSPNKKAPFSRKPLCGLFCKLQTKAFPSCKVPQRPANELSSSPQRRLLFWLRVQLHNAVLSGQSHPAARQLSPSALRE